jgi:outer membrane immunogenic protein
MKNVLMAGIATAAIYGAPAIAADVPVKAPVNKAVAHVYDWSGWYAGYNAGVAASQINGSTPGDDTGSTDVAGRGFAGGVQAGYNWHITPGAVAGVEGDLGFLRLKRSVIDYNDGETFSVKTQGYATFRARLGYSTGPSLFYLTGGIGLVRLTNTISEEGQGSNSTSRTKSGLVVGAGMETMLGGNWSARIEYLDLRTGDVSTDGDPAEASTVLFENRFHVFRYGLNYRFGGAAPALPAYNWSGFYAGVNAGVNLSQVGVRAPDAENEVDIASVSFAGGVHAGYNWQAVPNWFVGVEGDFGFLGADRSLIDWNEFDVDFGVKTGWYGTLRGRLGYSTGPALLYLTGGAAIVKLRNNFDDTDILLARKSKTAAGWTVGAGIETVLGQGWTAKTEYLYIDAGKNSVFNDNQGDIATFDNRFHVFRLGLNYKFGG